jgi:hydrogenase nickel incorporation protein HypA/HybF
MHETAIAESVLATILEQAEKLKSKPVSACISCGQFNRINEEVMQFAFVAASMGTVCEGMQLKIRHIPLRATCKQCHTTFEFDVDEPVCNACRNEQFVFIPDAPLLLEEVEFEEQTP